MENTLAIIVPVYNAETFLRQCVDSIIAAWRPGMEIILVNDGSSDSSGIICEEYGQKYENIKVVQKENGGVTSARAEGLLHSTAEYITYVDSDDWVDSDMYEKMMGKVAEYKVDAVVCDMVRETEKERVLLPSYVEAGYYDRKGMEEKIFPTMLSDFQNRFAGIAPSLCNKIFKRSVIQKIVMTADRTIAVGEDALCCYPALLDLQSIYVMNDCFYHYRMNFSSVTNGYDKSVMQKFLRLYDELRNQFEVRNFDDANQIDGYVAWCSLKSIRMELLYNKTEGLGKRIKVVKDYIENPSVGPAIDIAVKKISDKKVRTKLKLARKKRILVLFLLFWIREKVMKLRGKKYEN